MHFWLCLNKYFVSTISSDYFWISNIAVLWPKMLIFLDIQLFFCMDSQVKVRQLWFSSSWEIHHLQMMRSLVWSTQSSQILSQKSSFYRDQMLITITKQIMNSNLSSLYIIIEAWSRLIFIWHNNKLKNCYRIVGGDHWSQHNKDPPSQESRYCMGYQGIMMGICHGPRWTERLRDILTSTSGETRDDAVITYTNTPGRSNTDLKGSLPFLVLTIFDWNLERRLTSARQMGQMGPLMNQTKNESFMKALDRKSFWKYEQTDLYISSLTDQT